MLPFKLRHPKDPEHGPQSICSSISSNNSIVRNLGAPIMLPPGKHALSKSMLLACMTFNVPQIVDTI
jgi:hypothetical protein